MWFLTGVALGVLAGLVAGCLMCIKYVRHEVAADIGPRLRRIHLQLDNLEAAVNLAIVSRYADLAATLPVRPLLPADPVLPRRPKAPEPPFAA
jgi:hypothetical protein